VAGWHLMHESHGGEDRRRTQTVLAAGFQNAIPPTDREFGVHSPHIVGAPGLCMDLTAELGQLDVAKRPGRREGGCDALLVAPSVDRLLADLEVYRDLHDLLAGIQQVQDATPKLRWIPSCSHAAFPLTEALL